MSDRPARGRGAQLLKMLKQRREASARRREVSTEKSASSPEVSPIKKEPEESANIGGIPEARGRERARMMAAAASKALKDDADAETAEKVHFLYNILGRFNI